MSESRFYPPLHPDTPQETQEAFKQVVDHVYDLRNDMKAQADSHAQKIEEMNQKHASLQSQIDGQKFTSNIQGLNIKGVTDNLQDGMTLKWSASEGQFVIKL